MMGRTHALSGLVVGVAAGQFVWHLSPAHLAVAAAVAFTTGTRPERWVVAPLLLVALVWLVAVVEKVLPAGRLPLR